MPIDPCDLKPGRMQAICGGGDEPLFFTFCCGLCHNAEAMFFPDPIEARNEIKKTKGWLIHGEHGWICAGCRMFLDSIPEKTA